MIKASIFLVFAFALSASLVYSFKHPVVKVVHIKNKENNAKSQNKFVKDLFNANSVDDLKKLGVFVMEPPKTGAVIGRATSKDGPAAMTRSEDLKDATPGKCDPKIVCISNPLTLNITSPSQYAFPPCINIHRCDGCCPINEKCVAIKEHPVKLQKVGIVSYDADEAKYDGTSVIVSNHTECQCKCQWENDEDCRNVNPNFIKHPYSCECVCPEELSCNAFQEFDKASCSCVCIKEKYATKMQRCKDSGFYWNTQSCKCENVRPPVVREIKIIN